MASLLQNLLLVVLSVLVGFVLFEGVLRIFFADTIVFFPRYHTASQYGDYTLRMIRPNMQFRHSSMDGSWLFTTNNKGFRNYTDAHYAKPEGTTRVLSMGDSHTQGYEVRQDYTFSAVIEKDLLKRGMRAEVLNTGVSGFSTAEELAFLENEGVKYNSDYVVLGFYANDFEDNLKSGLFSLGQSGKLVVNKKVYVPGVRLQNAMYTLPLVQWFGENSYAFNFTFNSVWALAKNLHAQRAGKAAFEYAIATEQSASNYEARLAAA